LEPLAGDQPPHRSDPRSGGDVTRPAAFPQQATDGSLVSNIFSFPLQKEGLLMINAGDDDDDDDDDDEDDDSFNRETL